MNTFLLVGSTAVLACTAALAQPAVTVPPEARKSLSLTIYNGDLAMVRDVRTLDLGRGDARLEFADVSARIQPETAKLSAADTAIVEQNFDFDLLTPAKLLEKAVGSTIRIARVNPATGVETVEKALVLSANDGAVLKIGDRIEVLRAEGLPTRVIFDRVPENLRPQPTLSMLVASTRAGKRGAELSYLTGGLTWRADYVASYDEAAGKLDLQGWLTLTNKSGTAYVNAVTQVVAGDVRVVSGGDQIVVTGSRVRAQAVQFEEAREEALFDYHLYTLPRPTSIADNQTKQVGLLAAHGISAAKTYRYDSYGFTTFDEPQHFGVHLGIANAKTNNLGIALPSGVVRVYGADKGGAAQFLGEDRISHTADGARLDLVLGQAFDITVTAITEMQETISKTRTSEVVETTQRYTVKNAKDVAVTVELRQQGLFGNWQVREESMRSSKPDAHTAAWQVAVPAKGEAVLRFTMRVSN